MVCSSIDNHVCLQEREKNCLFCSNNLPGPIGISRSREEKIQHGDCLRGRLGVGGDPGYFSGLKPIFHDEVSREQCMNVQKFEF